MYTSKSPKDFKCLITASKAHGWDNEVAQAQKGLKCHPSINTYHQIRFCFESTNAWSPKDLTMITASKTRSKANEPGQPTRVEVSYSKYVSSKSIPFSINKRLKSEGLNYDTPGKTHGRPNEPRQPW